MDSIKKYDAIIIGSGPAGYSAAIYLARAGLKPLILSGMQPGGQLTITTDVENYPGFESIFGTELMERMSGQAVIYGSELEYDSATSVNFSNKTIEIKTSSSKTFKCKTLIICTGAQAKWLGLESEKFFTGYGVSGCATCDGGFFRGKKVAVIGGGNTAAEEALYLTNHASEVYLIHRRDSLRAEKIMQNRLMSNPKIKIIYNRIVEEICGNRDEKFVQSIKLKSTVDDKTILNGVEKIDKNDLISIDVDGVFVAIGHKPNTDLFKGKIDLDQDGYIITTPGSTKTSLPGVFAAGDVQDKIYRQAVTAAGTGCMAALDALKYLEENHLR